MYFPHIQGTPVCSPRIQIRAREQILVWVESSVRIILAVIFFLAAGLAMSSAFAEWFSLQETPEGFRNAIRFAPWNAEYYAGMARSLERPLKPQNLTEVIRLYEKAVQLSPRDAAYWSRLGNAYEWAGRDPDALHAYAQALSLSPGSPAMNWVAANFYLREGAPDCALELLRETILLDPGLRRPAFDLAWRATQDGELIAGEMIPSRPDVQFEYLRYLVETGRIDEATAAWNRAVERGYPPDPKTAFPYMDALIQHQRIGLLKAAWSAMTRNDPSAMDSGKGDSNLLVNGGFERDILNGGMDWRMNSEQGAAITMDRATPFEGMRSLEIKFDGTQNLADALVYEYVPVEPNTSFSFSGYMRALNITTDSGPRFEICDADVPARLFIQTEGVLGNSSWTVRQLNFRTGPETRLLMVRVTRPASGKLASRISGTVWVDQLELHVAEKPFLSAGERNE
jgi:hypothetical protein